MNLTLANEGQAVANDYLYSMFLGHFFGLFCIVSFPDGRDVLLFSNTSGTPAGAAKRYQATIAQVLTWYLSMDMTDPNVAKSLQGVRDLHIAAQEAATYELESGNPLVNYSSIDLNLKTCLNGPFFEDLIQSDIPDEFRLPPPSHWMNITALPVNQQIMALTQFAFIGFPFLYPERLAMAVTNEQLWSFNHLW
jgi:hypothetical protein